jgi:hypothetical protein
MFFVNFQRQHFEVFKSLFARHRHPMRRAPPWDLGGLDCVWATHKDLVAASAKKKARKTAASEKPAAEAPAPLPAVDDVAGAAPDGDSSAPGAANLAQSSAGGPEELIIVLQILCSRFVLLSL